MGLKNQQLCSSDINTVSDSSSTPVASADVQPHMTKHQEELLLLMVAIEDCLRDSVIEVARKFIKFPVQVEECVFSADHVGRGEQIIMRAVVLVEGSKNEPSD